jgi:hypothetical protein
MNPLRANRRSSQVSASRCAATVWRHPIVIAEVSAAGLCGCAGGAFLN